MCVFLRVYMCMCVGVYVCMCFCVYVCVSVLLLLFEGGCGAGADGLGAIRDSKVQILSPPPWVIGIFFITRDSWRVSKTQMSLDRVTKRSERDNSLR